MEVVMHSLACHPHSCPAAVRSVEAGLCQGPGGALALRFVLTGDMAHIELPALRDPCRTDGLWRHTCFECFIRTGEHAYLEFNLSPSSDWAAYAFRGYREAAPLPPAFDPQIRISRRAGTLELEAMVPAAALTRERTSGPWRAGLCAVVEESSGLMTYWALRHAPGKPDFHHPHAFAYALQFREP